MRHPREKNPKYLKYIRGIPCIICKNPHVEAAHLRMGDIRRGKRHVGIGEKPDDIWTLPLCSSHHRQQHSMGEQMFWELHGIDPVAVCQNLLKLFLE